MAGGTCTWGHVDMVEHCRHPAVGGVAVIAAVVAGDVVGRLARGRAAVVTAEAGAEHSGMVDADYRVPGVGAVTVLAQVRGLYMGTGLAGRGAAVVTA